jgi:hypothetical protein
MARRRVFKVRTHCSGLTLRYPTDRSLFIGRSVILEKMPDSTTGVSLDGSVVGHLPESVSAQVASALDRGQTFTAKIINAYQDYDANLKATTVSLDLKVEYPLEEGQPAIDAPTRPFVVDGPTSAVSPSFFTKIAGVTHERRQSIVARCSEGERLLLLREPGNPVDPGAIKVLRQNGQHLGYIPAHVSRHGDPSGLAFRMDQGIQCGCRIKNLTVCGPGESLGGNI